MAEVPVILCFDDRILTGAGVTILSAIDSAADQTTYRFFVLHPGLPEAAIHGLQRLAAGTRHQIVFRQIPAERFAGVPKNRGSWTEIVYYRLLACEVLPEIDRAIYSDVDVFVMRDLSEVFSVDLEGCDWAGVAAERNDAGAVTHRHFPENPKDNIYFSGFMVMNLERMRETGAVARYFETIATFGDRLKFFDLDVLNLATERIAPLPFAYVTLEDIYEVDDVTASRDYAYLKSVYSVAEIEAARDDPAIVHFAGRRGKPWQRQQVPEYYRAVANRLPGYLRRGTFRDFRKRWLSRKGWRRFPTRSR